MTGVFIRKRRGNFSIGTQEDPHKAGVRDWSYAATSKDTPGATKSWKRQRRILYQRYWRECVLGDTLILDFWTLEL